MKNAKPKENYLKIFISIIVLVSGILLFISIQMESEFALDFILTIIIALLLYKLKYKLNQTNFSISVGLLALMLHNMGLFGAYSLTFGNIFRFEHIMHLVGGFAGFVMAYYFLFKLSKTKRLIAAALISMGGGSIIEIMEYIGYGVLGSGEGLFFYGVGDFGEWANSSIDMLNNMIGASIGALVYTLKDRKKTKKNLSVYRS